MTAYYNEIDPLKAETLRVAIAAGAIAPGDVDERSIADIRPADLVGYTQCHFFAGGGFWSLALRLAGWPDDRPVWTGSCPCPSFSAAGKGLGFDDPRHLWPAWSRLIRECKPATVFGEQADDAIGYGWLDLVQTDLEAEAYAVGKAVLGACSVGGSDIRQRLYFVAHAAGSGFKECIASGRIYDSAAFPSTRATTFSGSHTLRMADAGHGHEHDRCELGSTPQGISGKAREQRIRLDPGHGGNSGERSSPLNGPWRDADWLLCRDGKWRPVSPVPQSLVDGSAESLGFIHHQSVAELEREINEFALARQTRPSEVLRDLHESLSAEASRFREPGSRSGLHEAPFLLAFLRQLSEQGWRFATNPSVPSAKTPKEELRMLRDDELQAGSSRKPGLERRSSRKHSDSLHLLSSLLARHAHQAWFDAYSAYAEIGFPLGHKCLARVARLRTYGDAINVEVAKTFVEACLEIIN